MEEGFTVAVDGSDEVNHILEVALGGDVLLEVVALGFHAVFIGGVVDDALLLRWGHLSGVNPQGDAVLLPKPTENGLFAGGGGILTEGIDTAIGVATEVVVWIKFHHRRGNHIQIAFDDWLLGAGAFGLGNLLFLLEEVREEGV